MGECGDNGGCRSSPSRRSLVVETPEIEMLPVVSDTD